MTQHQIVGYDFTLPKNDTWPDRHVVVKHLKEWCKNYVFQEEKGDTGYEHWQGRVRLIKARRFNEIKGKFCPGGNISPTTGDEFKTKSFSYVMKADSRVSGPWDERCFEEPPPLTRQLTAFNGLDFYPWQQAVYDMVLQTDDRSIKLIYDPIGNVGKSIFCEYLEYHQLAYEIPPFRQMEDLMQCCMSIKTQKAYIVDMPRGMKKDKLGEFYSGLECIKNGVCYDKRYSFKKRRFDRPQVIVFTNTLPVWYLMSADRWEVWEMTSDKSLKKYNISL